MNLISAMGLFLWPLLMCSLAAVFITVERYLALRNGVVAPSKLVDQVIAGKPPQASAKDASAAARILYFADLHEPQPEALKAYAQLEMARLERGLFVLDIVVGAAPLLGLLGTVAGLMEVFGAIDPATGLPDALEFVSGIAMALATTTAGLAIALPALAAGSFLNRRVEVLRARLNVLVERLIDLRHPAPKTP